MRSGAEAAQRRPVVGRLAVDAVDQDVDRERALDPAQDLPHGPDRLAAVARAGREVEERVGVEEEPGDRIVVGSGPEAGRAGPIEEVTGPPARAAHQLRTERQPLAVEERPRARPRRARTRNAAPRARRRPGQRGEGGTGSHTTSAAHVAGARDTDRPRITARVGRRRSLRRSSMAVPRGPGQGGVIANSCLSLSSRASWALRMAWKASSVRVGLVRPAGLAVGASQLEVEAAVLVRREGGLEVGHGALGLSALDVRASEHRAGPEETRVGAHGLLEARDRLRRLLRVQPRLSEQQVELRRVRLVLQEVLEERSGLRVLVGDEGERRLLAANPQVVRPERSRLPQLLLRLEVAPLRAERVDAHERGLRRGRQRLEAGEGLAGQLPGRAGGPVAALRGAQQPGRVEDLPVPGRAEVALQARRGPAVGRRDSSRPVALHGGPLRVAAALVDLREGLVGLGEPGLLRDRLAKEGEGALVALLGHHALGDEQQDEVASRAPRPGAARRRGGTGPRSCGRARNTTPGSLGSCSERERYSRAALSQRSSDRSAPASICRPSRCPGSLATNFCRGATAWAGCPSSRYAAPRKREAGARSGRSFSAAWSWGTASRSFPAIDRAMPRFMRMPGSFGSASTTAP